VKEVIEPALKAGKIVVSDRFLDSSLAYQGAARGLGIEQILQISEWATGGLLPDLVFYLSVDPQEGLARSKGEPGSRSPAADGSTSRGPWRCRSRARR